MRSGTESPAPIIASTKAAASVWEDEARGLRRIPIYAGVIVALVGGYVFLGGDEVEPIASAAAAPAEPDPAQPKEEAGPDETPPPAQEPAAVVPSPEPGAEAPAPEASVGELAADDTADDATPAATEPARRKPRAAGGAARRGTKGTARKVTPQVAPAKSEEQRVAEALEAGWMRASGDLLLVFPSNAKTSWENALGSCRRRHEAGLKGWRLPTVKELRALRRSNQLPMGTWWSSTDGSDSSTAMALTTSSADATQTAKADPGGQPLCVRRR